jgi:hypothetical protein
MRNGRFESEIKDSVAERLSTLAYGTTKRTSGVHSCSSRHSNGVPGRTSSARTVAERVNTMSAVRNRSAANELRKLRVRKKMHIASQEIANEKC